MKQIRIGAFTFLALTLAFGCQKSTTSQMPPLYPVHGIVTKEGKPIPEAFVQFVPESGAQDLTINGRTNPEGKYELTTLSVRNNEKKPGAPEGTYTVNIMMPLDAQQRGGEQYQLPDKYQVKPGANEFPLEIYPKNK